MAVGQLPTEVPCTEARYSHLLNLIHQVREVRDSIRNLHSELGVRSDPKQDCEKEQEPPNNLVDVVDRLPGMVSKECGEIHSLLNEIKNNLV